MKGAYKTYRTVLFIPIFLALLLLIYNLNVQSDCVPKNNYFPTPPPPPSLLQRLFSNLKFNKNSFQNNILKTNKNQYNNRTAYPNVCFLSRTFAGQMHTLPAFVFSLYATRYPHFKIIFLNTDDQPMSGMEDMIYTFNNMYGKETLFFSGLSKGNVDFPFFDKKANDYGYFLTDLLMRDIVHKNEYDCDYLVVTNGDNLYSIEFFNAMETELKEQYDLIATQFVSRYCWDAKFDVGQFCKLQCNPQIYTAFKKFAIDLGAVVMRVEFLRNYNRYFVTSPDFLSYNISVAHSADGDYMEAAAEATNKTKIIERTLFFHQ